MRKRNQPAQPHHSFVAWRPLLGGIGKGVLALLTAFGPPLVAGPLWPAIQIWWQGPVNPGLVAYVSNDEALGNSYVDLLTDPALNVRARHLGLDQLNDLLWMRPEFVIFGSSNREPPHLDIRREVKDFLIHKAKVVGMGTLGGNVFDQIEPNSGLSLGRIKAIPTSDVTLDPRLTDVDLDLDTKNPFPVFVPVGNGDDSSASAVYDRGNLRGAGFTGIAKYANAITACAGEQWPVIQHDNHLFWGFATDAYNLTPEGHRLFINVVQHMKKTVVPELKSDVGFTAPGQHTDYSLTCQYSATEYRLKIDRPGSLKVRVSATKAVVLSLTPPGEPTLEQEGKKPALIYEVSARSVTEGGPWIVTVTSTSSSHDRTRYGIEIAYEPSGYTVPRWLTPLTAIFSVSWLAISLLVILALTGRLPLALRRIPGRLPLWRRRRPTPQSARKGEENAAPAEPVAPSSDRTRPD